VYGHSLSYPACKFQNLCVALHHHLACQALPYFSTLSDKRHDFRKNVPNMKYVLIFCTGTFLILRRIARDTVDVLKFSCKVCSYCQLLVKHEFSWQIFKRYSNVMKIRPLGCWIIPCGQVYRQEEVNSCTSQFCERAWKPWRLDVVV